jgi:hypothetical protein
MESDPCYAYSGVPAALPPPPLAARVRSGLAALAARTKRRRQGEDEAVAPVPQATPAEAEAALLDSLTPARLAALRAYLGVSGSASVGGGLCSNGGSTDSDASAASTAAGDGGWAGGPHGKGSAAAAAAAAAAAYTHPLPVSPTSALGRLSPASPGGHRHIPSTGAPCLRLSLGSALRRHSPPPIPASQWRARLAAARAAAVDEHAARLEQRRQGAGSGRAFASAPAVLAEADRRGSLAGVGPAAPVLTCSLDAAWFFGAAGRRE